MISKRARYSTVALESLTIAQKVVNACLSLLERMFTIVFHYLECDSDYPIQGVASLVVSKEYLHGLIT